MDRPIEPTKSKAMLPLALVLSTLVAGILIGTVISGQADAAREASEPVTDAKPLMVPAADPVENQFSELARRVRPAVVSIEIPASRAEEEDSGEERFPSNPEDLFRRFFGMPPDGRTPSPPRRGPGQGSGVIVDAKGYIITNHHVVDGAERIRVRFVDDDELHDAKLIGADAETDLAVIHVEGQTGLQAARMGNSDAVNVGDWAVAIGSPFGYRETVTVGIISATAREGHGDFSRARPFKKYLQTDAAINPGNSGGPLLNIRGEVVGINTAIISRTGGYDGIGFALASNITVETYNQIIRFGRVSRGSIGVEFSGDQNISLLRSYGAETGVFVRRAFKDGPAAEAGMRSEDIIVSVDGKKIEDGDSLIAVVSGIDVGRTVPVEIVRSGTTKVLDVTIRDRAKMYPEQAEARPGTGDDEEEASVRLGVTVQAISPERREQMDLGEDGGVLVTKVEARSFAEDVGLMAGDVVLAVNRMEINAISELREIQKSLEPGMDVAFKVKRTDGREWQTVYVAGVVPE